LSPSGPLDYRVLLPLPLGPWVLVVAREQTASETAL